jgi:hypothetical protein
MGFRARADEAGEFGETPTSATSAKRDVEVAKRADGRTASCARWQDARATRASKQRTRLQRASSAVDVLHVLRTALPAFFVGDLRTRFR